MVLLSDLARGAGRPTAADFDRPTYDPTALAVLQYTSGSTAEPKGVMLPNRTICANLDGIATAAAFDPDTDVLVSWLPLQHQPCMRNKPCAGVWHRAFPSRWTPSSAVLKNLPKPSRPCPVASSKCRCTQLVS